MIDRREFLKFSALTGAAVLAGGRSVAAEAAKKGGGAPAVDTGAHEVLRLTPLRIKAGAVKPFKALHISDTHLNLWDTADIGGNKSLKACFDQRWVRFPQAVNSFLAALDYACEREMTVLHSGDLIDWNTGANLRFLGRSLRGTDFLLAAGNHEYRVSKVGGVPVMTAEEARNALGKTVPNVLTVASRIVNGVNIVVFDDGELNVREETIAGVRSEFEKGLPVVLMCHIPPPMRKLARNPYDEKTLGFFNWLRERRQLKAILCGHNHSESRVRFSDTADVIVAGANLDGRGYEVTFS